MSDRLALILLVAGSLAGACGRDESPPALGTPRTPTVETNPIASRAMTEAGAGQARLPAMPDARIVSLSPLATRFLFELGVGARIVAVDPASQKLPGLARVPVTDLPGAADFEPGLIVVAALPPGPAPSAAAGTEVGPSAIPLVEFAPHDLEDVYALCRTLGHPLVGEDEATLMERRIARPLALVAGESPPEPRPRVVALIGLHPLEIAGGHSFETDLIEVAGGTSVTHGGDDLRRVVDREDVRRLEPDLIVAITPRPLSPLDQDQTAALVGDLAPVVFFQVDRETFWLERPAEDATRLRDLMRPFRPAIDADAAGTLTRPRGELRAPIAGKQPIVDW